LSKPRAIPVHANNLGARLRESEGKRPAQAARGARDDSPSPLNFEALHIHYLPFVIFKAVAIE
jgi:hypothetical protein